MALALRAVIEHPKFARLKSLLKCNRFVALGVLEGLWHFCGRYTPQGNIGKYSDAEIEAWIEWDGEEGALIAALTKARWIDADSTHRLLVHDWHLHADAATKLSLKRSGLSFVILPLSEHCCDTVATPLGLPVPEPEPDKKETPPTEGQRKKARPDSLEEVQAFFVSVGSTAQEAEKFFLNKSAIEWKQSGVPIKCWKSAARYWLTPKDWQKPVPQQAKQLTREERRRLTS